LGAASIALKKEKKISSWGGPTDTPKVHWQWEERNPYASGKQTIFSQKGEIKSGKGESATKKAKKNSQNGRTNQCSFRKDCNGGGLGKKEGVFQSKSRTLAGRGVKRKRPPEGDLLPERGRKKKDLVFLKRTIVLNTEKRKRRGVGGREMQGNH